MRQAPLEILHQKKQKAADFLESGNLYITINIIFRLIYI